MATAYAALLSVKQILNQLEQHPRPPISLHQQHLHSLTENLDFFQDFLERSCSEEEELEMRIAGVAHAAEDAIESHIVDQIHARSTCHAQNLGCVDFYETLERVIQDMDSIKKEVVGAHLHQLRINPSISTAPLRSVSRMQNNTMVDFGDIVNQVLDKLTGQPDRLQTIPIVGMGGIGSIFQLANMRCICMIASSGVTISSSGDTISSSFPIFWNLQILVLSASLKEILVPSEIWELALLRHVIVQQLELKLPDPPYGDDNIVLVNLQTLSYIRNCKFSEEMVKRIANVKTLKLEYNENILLEEEGSTNSFLKNLGHLQKLESLRLNIASEVPDLLVHNLVQYLNFPHSLKKLTLICTMLSWEELTTKIGSLPHLEVLKLNTNSCIGLEWETIEGKFCSLKFLLIHGCIDLKKWKMEETHFPRLEHLGLEYLYNLEEIPSSVGDIPTLQSIKLNFCSKSAEESAERIVEEQEDNGNVDLKIHIDSGWY